MRLLILCATATSLSLPAQHVDLLGYLDYPVRTSNIWGHTDSAGTEYALVGLYDGVSIVDISTDSTQPVELFHIPGVPSIWRELKTWNDHAYVVSQDGGGLQVIDLTNLPASVDTFYYHTDSLSQDTLIRAHTIFIDENGFAYLFGSNLGTCILDLNPDPKHPLYAGRYTHHYVHDGFVRGDTLWAAEIQDGLLTAVDVSNKSNPVVLGSIQTPYSATHNVWLTDDAQYAFTTDERTGAPVTSFDVTDVTDMQKLDELYSHPGTGVVPHNTYWRNGWLITANYKDGVVIADAHRPQNLVVTGWYDTSPFPPEEGFRGCWGVYPYLPSGKIIATDIDEGLFVLRPRYKRACYLEGQATDDVTSVPVPGARIELINTSVNDSTGISGDYKVGIADSGFYDVRFSHPNCQTVIVQDVALQPGIISTLNVQMDCPTLGVSSHDEDFRCWFDPHSQTLRWQISGQGQRHLTLSDLNGRKLFHSDLNAQAGSLFPSQLPTGVYVASLVGPDSIEASFVIPLIRR